MTGQGTAAVRWLARGVHDVPESGDWLSPAESARLAGLRFPKRRSEVRLARWAAKQAVTRALNLGDDAGTLARVEIRAARTGAPVAFVGEEPAPLAVSMTDRADWAVCVVAPAGLAVGCDLELVEPRSDLFVRDWFTPGEQRLVAGADSGDERHLIANLVWSAKESALKVLQTGLRRSTRSVEVDVVEGAGHERWSRLVVRAEEGTAFPGWWRRYGDFVLTFAAAVGCGPPVSLEDPPRLAAASPSHSWLTGPG
ncbi:MAG TPA: 4'-phosphopantetheinyl transferase superfamily protein [Acidimicrobiales bacterium]|nr:4'-phosphopantetheinyl transferase superfamily protein [Acidimicrobiales bacterium]